MPKIVAAMRIKDDEDFLIRTIPELTEYISELVLIDNWCCDRSLDIIYQVCSENNVPLSIWRTPDEHFHEKRDKDQLLRLAHEVKAEWIFNIDADEVYERAFVENIENLCTQTKINSWSFGATHLWSIEDRKDWWNIDTFRVDNGWGKIEYIDKTWSQHEKPTLFRAIKGQIISSAFRYDGYICPPQLVPMTVSSGYIFAHWGYATPEFRNKKAIRHGKIPYLSEKELQGQIVERPGWKPLNFDEEKAIQEYKRAWVNPKKTDLRRLRRRIWK